MKYLFILISLFFSILVSMSVFSKATSTHPAAVVELTITSDEKRMSGFSYLASGEGPHPTVLLLHGYPGNEKNLDVAQAMRSKGWNVVFFHYRGSWGSEGEFSFRNAEKDVQVVLDYMMKEENAIRLRIDPNQISVVGHSMGGHMAIAGTLDNPLVKCSVAYDGVNLGAKGVGFINDPNTEIDWLKYSDSLFMLNGWSGKKSKNEITLYAKELDLVRRADRINGRPVMLIAANTHVVPIELHIKPLYEALNATKSSKISYLLIEDDHSFSSSRTLLIKETAKFLNKSCKN